MSGCWKIAHILEDEWVNDTLVLWLILLGLEILLFEWIWEEIQHLGLLQSMVCQGFLEFLVKSCLG